MCIVSKMEIKLEDFYNKIKEAYIQYLQYGSRSIKKIAPIHQWIGETYQKLLGNEYQVDYSNKEKLKINGRYYPKEVDIKIQKSQKNIFVISFKFITSNYKQNVNNFFENLLGECANIRTKNIGFGHILVLRNKIPYSDKEGNIKKWEIPNDKDLGKYITLFNDRSKYFHSPNYLCIEIVSIAPIIEEVISSSPGTSGYSEDFYKKEIKPRLNELKIENGICGSGLSPHYIEFIKENMNLQKFFQDTIKFIQEKS